MPPSLVELRPRVLAAWETVASWPARVAPREGVAEAGARRFALAAARTFAAIGLLEQTAWAAAEDAASAPLWVEAARRWCDRGPAAGLDREPDPAASRRLALGG